MLLLFAGPLRLLRLLLGLVALRVIWLLCCSAVRLGAVCSSITTAVWPNRCVWLSLMPCLRVWHRPDRPLLLRLGLGLFRWGLLLA